MSGGRRGWWALGLAQLLGTAVLAAFLLAGGSLPWWVQLLLVSALAIGSVRLLGGLVVTRRWTRDEEIRRARADAYVRRLR